MSKGTCIACGHEIHDRQRTTHYGSSHEDATRCIENVRRDGDAKLAAVQAERDRIVTYLVGRDGDIDDALDRAKLLENDAINHECLMKLHTQYVEQNVSMSERLNECKRVVHGLQESTKGAIERLNALTPEYLGGGAEWHEGWHEGVVAARAVLTAAIASNGGA
jgi:hypothetical protein